MNKKQTIQYLSEGGKIKVVSPNNRCYGIERKAIKIQTNAVQLEPVHSESGSWLYFKNLNPKWITSQGFKIGDLSGGFIEYAFMEMGKIRKIEAKE